MPPQYKVIKEIEQVRVIHNGELDDINIPIGTICTEESYGMGDIEHVYCTVNGIEYRDIAFPPHIFKEAYVESYTAPSGGRRRRTFRRTYRPTKRHTIKRTVKRKRKTHRSF